MIETHNIIDLLVNAIDPDAVESGDNYHIIKAQKAAHKVLTILADSYIICQERLNYDNSLQVDLPVPRLQLVWDKPKWGSDAPQETAEQNGEWVCWYQLITPDRWTDGEVTVKTLSSSSMSGAHPIDNDGNIRPSTLLSDITRDMTTLGLPGYHIYKNTIRVLDND